MSTSIAAANGVVVVTQMFPQGGNDMVANCAQIQSAPPSMGTTKESEMTTFFLRGQPQSLGIVQLFIGLVFVVGTLSSLLSSTQVVQVPVFMGIACILTGTLSIVTSRKATISCLIRGTLALNIISVFVAAAAVAYLCMVLIVQKDDSRCHYEDDSYRYFRGCKIMAQELSAVNNGVRGLLLVLAVLEMCLAVTGCVFSGGALRRHGNHLVVMESGGAPPTSAAPLYSNEPLLGIKEVVAMPPPYSA